MASTNPFGTIFEQQEDNEQQGFASPTTTAQGPQPGYVGWGDINDEQRRAVEMYYAGQRIPMTFTDPVAVRLRNKQDERMNVERTQELREGVSVVESLRRFPTQFGMGVKQLQGTEAGARDYHQFNILDLAKNIRENELVRQQVQSAVEEIKPEHSTTNRYNVLARTSNVLTSMYPGPNQPTEFPQQEAPETTINIGDRPVNFTLPDLEEALDLADSQRFNLENLSESKIEALQKEVSEDERQLAIAAAKAPVMEERLEEFLLKADTSDPDFWSSATELLDPSNVIELAGQSMPMQGIGMLSSFGAGALATVFTRNPAAGRGAAGLAGAGTTYMMEYQMEMTAELLEAGAPLFNVRSMRDWVSNNREEYENIQRNADIRAGIIAAGEGVSMGVAGLTKGTILKAIRSLRINRAMNKARRASKGAERLGGTGFMAAEMAMQGVTAGGAEALAAVAQGKDINASEVMVEGWLEAVLGGTMETLGTVGATSLANVQDRRVANRQRRAIAEWLRDATITAPSLSPTAAPVEGIAADLERMTGGLGAQMGTPRLLTDAEGNTINEGFDVSNLQGPTGFQSVVDADSTLGPVTDAEREQPFRAQGPYSATTFGAGSTEWSVEAVTDQDLIEAGLKVPEARPITDEDIEQAIEVAQREDETVEVNEALSLALNAAAGDGNFGKESKLSRGERQRLGWNVDLRGYEGDFQKLYNLRPTGLSVDASDGRAYVLHVDRGPGRYKNRVFLRAISNHYVDNVQVFNTEENGGVQEAIAWLSKKYERDAELERLRKERAKFFEDPKNQEANRILIDRIEPSLNATAAKDGNEWTRKQAKLESIDPVSGEVRYTYKVKMRGTGEYKTKVGIVNFLHPEMGEKVLSPKGSKAVVGSVKRKDFIVRKVRDAMGLGKYSAETGQPFKPAAPKKGMKERNRKEFYHKHLAAGASIEEAERLADASMREQERVYNMLIAQPTQSLVDAKTQRKEEIKEEIAALRQSDADTTDSVRALEQELSEIDEYLQTRGADSPQRKEGVDQRRWPSEWKIPVHPLDEGGKEDIRVFVAKADIAALRDTLNNKAEITPYVTALMATGDRQVREVRVYLDVDPSSENYGKFVAEIESEGGLQYDQAITLGPVEGMDFGSDQARDAVIDRISESYPQLTSNERRRSARAKALNDVMALRRQDRETGKYKFGRVGYGSIRAKVPAADSALPSSVSQSIIGTGRQTQGWEAGPGDRAFEEAMEAGMRAEGRYTALPEQGRVTDRTFTTALQFRTGAIDQARSERRVAKQAQKLVKIKDEEVFNRKWDAASKRQRSRASTHKGFTTKARNLRRQAREAELAETEAAVTEERQPDMSVSEALVDRAAIAQERADNYEKMLRKSEEELEAFALASEMREMDDPMAAAEARARAADLAVERAKTAKRRVQSDQTRSNEDRLEGLKKKDAETQLNRAQATLVRLETEEATSAGADPELAQRIEAQRSEVRRLQNIVDALEGNLTPSSTPVEPAAVTEQQERTPARSKQLNRMRARRAAQNEFRSLADEIFRKEFGSRIEAGQEPMSYEDMTALLKETAETRFGRWQGLLREERNRYIEGDQFTIRSFLRPPWQMLTEEQARERRESEALNRSLREEFERQAAEEGEQLVEVDQTPAPAEPVTMDGIPIPGQEVRDRDRRLTPRLDEIDARLAEVEGVNDPGARQRAARLRGERVIAEGERTMPEQNMARRLSEVENELEALSGSDMRTLNRRIVLRRERNQLLREIEAAMPDEAPRSQIVRDLGQETTAGPAGTEITPEGWRLLSVMAATDAKAVADAMEARQLENWWMRKQGTTLESYNENIEVMAEIMDMTPQEVRDAATRELREAYRREILEDSARVANYADEIEAKSQGQDYIVAVSLDLRDAYYRQLGLTPPPRETEDGNTVDEKAAAEIDTDAMLQADLDALHLVIDSDDFDLSVNASIAMARAARTADTAAEVRNLASIVYKDKQKMVDRANAMSSPKYRKLRFEAAVAKEKGDTITYNKKVKALAAQFQQEMDRIDWERTERKRKEALRKTKIRKFMKSPTVEAAWEMYTTGPAHLLLTGPPGSVKTPAKPMKLPPGMRANTDVDMWLAVMLNHTWVNYHGFMSTRQADLGTTAWSSMDYTVDAPVYDNSIIQGINEHGAALAVLLTQGAALGPRDAAWIAESRLQQGAPRSNIEAELEAITGGGGRLRRTVARAGTSDPEGPQRPEVDTPEWNILKKYLLTDRGLPDNYNKFASKLNAVGAVAKNDVDRVKADLALIKAELDAAGIPYDRTTHKAMNLYLEDQPLEVAEDVLGGKFPRDAVRYMDRIKSKIHTLSKRLSDNTWAPLHVRARIDERGQGYLHTSTNLKRRRGSVWNRMLHRLNPKTKKGEIDYVKRLVGQENVDNLVKAVHEAAGLTKEREFLEGLTKGELAYRLRNTYGIETIPNPLDPSTPFTVKGSHRAGDPAAIEKEGMIEFILSNSFDTSSLETHVLRTLETATREFSLEANTETRGKESAFRGREFLLTEQEQIENLMDVWLKPDPVEDRGTVSDILTSKAGQALRKANVSDPRAEADRLKAWLRQDRTLSTGERVGRSKNLFDNFAKELVQEFPWTADVVSEYLRFKEVSDAYRKAMGEVVNVESKVVDTVSRLALIGERNNVLQSLFQQLANDGYLRRAEGTIPDGWVTVSGEDKDGGSILNSADFSFTLDGQTVIISSEPTGDSRSLADFVIPYDMKWAIKSLMNDLPRGWFEGQSLSTINAMAKYTLVIPNPGAHPRNAWSSGYIGMARGINWTPGSKWGEGMRVATKIGLRQLASVAPHTIPLWDGAIDRLVNFAARNLEKDANRSERNLVRVLSAGAAKGVLGDGARARALLDIVNHARMNGKSLTEEQAQTSPHLFGEYLLEQIEAGNLGEIPSENSTVWEEFKQKVEGVSSSGQKRAAEILRFAEEAFRLEDEAIKIAAFVKYARFFAELKGLEPDAIDLYLNASLDDRGNYEGPSGNDRALTTQEQEQVNDIFKMTGEHVKDLFPTFSRVPEIARWLNRQFWVGAFPSFQFEMARNTWKQATYLSGMLRGKMPDGTVLEGKARTKAKLHALSMIPVFATIGLGSNITFGLARRALSLGGGGGDDSIDETALYSPHDWQATAMSGPWDRFSHKYFVSVDTETGDYVMDNFSHVDPSGGHHSAAREVVQEIQDIIDQYGALDEIPEGSPAWAMLEYKTFKPIATILETFGFRDEVFISKVSEKYKENMRKGFVTEDKDTFMQSASQFLQKIGQTPDAEGLENLYNLFGPIASAMFEAMPFYEMLDQGEELANHVFTGNVDALTGFAMGTRREQGNLYVEGVNNLYFRLGELKLANRRVFNELQEVLEGSSVDEAVARAYLAEQDRQKAATDVYLFLRAARDTFQLTDEQAMGLVDMATTGKYEAIGPVEEIAGMDVQSLLYGQGRAYNPEDLTTKLEQMDGLDGEQRQIMSIAVNRLSERFQ